jgi:hypothetical protein
MANWDFYSFFAQALNFPVFSNLDVNNIWTGNKLGNSRHTLVYSPGGTYGFIHGGARKSGTVWEFPAFEQHAIGPQSTK